MDMSSSRGQDLTDRPLPTAEGLAPRKLRWEVVVCDNAMPEPRGTARAGAGDCGPRGGGSQPGWDGLWAGGSWEWAAELSEASPIGPGELGPHPPRASVCPGVRWAVGLLDPGLLL